MNMVCLLGDMPLAAAAALRFARAMRRRRRRIQCLMRMQNKGSGARQVMQPRQTNVFQKPRDSNSAPPMSGPSR